MRRRCIMPIYINGYWRNCMRDAAYPSSYCKQHGAMSSAKADARQQYERREPSRIRDRG